MTDEPHTPTLSERLALAQAAGRCGAKCRNGSACRSPAMGNGRCRMHGGLSTGPRTADGLARSRRSNWKHGYYSAQAKQVRREALRKLRLLRQLIAAAGEDDDVLDLISSM
ncbi:MAG: HGGxSTG domain-containing protein [Microvirga sp.]